MSCVGQIDCDYNEIRLEPPFAEQLNAIHELVAQAVEAGLTSEDQVFSIDEVESPFSLRAQAWVDHLASCGVTLEHLETDDSPGHCQRLCYIHVKSNKDAEALSNAMSVKLIDIEQEIKDRTASSSHRGDNG